MFATIRRQLATVGLAATLFAVTALASEPATVAVVTTAKNAEIRVEQFQLRESPGGQWITERPNRFAEELYFRVQKDGVTIRRVIPFGEIETIDFTTFVAKDAMNPEVRKMMIKLRNKSSVEWIHADRAVITTTASGQKETWQSFPWLSGVVSSGEKEQGHDYVITGFTGYANVGSERVTWEAAPTDIKRIRFIGIQ